MLLTTFKNLKLHLIPTCWTRWTLSLIIPLQEIWWEKSPREKILNPGRTAAVRAAHWDITAYLGNKPVHRAIPVHQPFTAWLSSWDQFHEPISWESISGFILDENISLQANITPWSSGNRGHVYNIVKSFPRCLVYMGKLVYYILYTANTKDKWYWYSDVGQHIGCGNLGKPSYHNKIACGYLIPLLRHFLGTQNKEKKPCWEKDITVNVHKSTSNCGFKTLTWEWKLQLKHLPYLLFFSTFYLPCSINLLLSSWLPPRCSWRANENWLMRWE